jgi:hypothetical protein
LRASALDELLPAVDVEGRTGHRGVRHEVDGERGDVLRPDDAPDRQGRSKLLETRTAEAVMMRNMQAMRDWAPT